MKRTVLCLSRTSFIFCICTIRDDLLLLVGFDVPANLLYSLDRPEILFWKTIYCLVILVYMGIFGKVFIVLYLWNIIITVLGSFSGSL